MQDVCELLVTPDAYWRTAAAFTTVGVIYIRPDGKIHRPLYSGCGTENNINGSDQRRCYQV
jgi:hypothetical protein